MIFEKTSPKVALTNWEKVDNFFRESLWRDHGCDERNLYGDDGEMQCGGCGIDFKRMPLSAIAALLKQKNPDTF